MSAKIEAVGESGAVLFMPLNKLKKPPKNARRTPHSEADIEALAASVRREGLAAEPRCGTGAGPPDVPWNAASRKLVR